MLWFGKIVSPAYVNIKRNKQPKSELWKTDSLTSSKNSNCNPFNFSSSLFAYALLSLYFFLPFILSINALGGYFYVSLYLVAIHTVWSSWIKMCRNAALKHIPITFHIPYTFCLSDCVIIIRLFPCRNQHQAFHLQEHVFLCTLSWGVDVPYQEFSMYFILHIIFSSSLNV